MGGSRRPQSAGAPPAHDGSRPFAGMTSPSRMLPTEAWSSPFGTTTGLATRISWEEQDLIWEQGNTEDDPVLGWIPPVKKLRCGNMLDRPNFWVEGSISLRAV